MPKPLVSLIIPVYNGASFIEQLAQNLQSFSYRSLEVIIGDDCSTDSTHELILKHKDSFPRLKIYRSECNIGPGAMRNRLIDLACGEYIAIQDCDDLSTSNRINDLINYFDLNTSCDIVGSSCSLSWHGSVWGTISPPSKPSTIHWLLQKSVVHASIMARRIVFDKCRYCESLRIGEDFYFLTSAYLNNFKFYNIQEALYIYNVAPEDLRSRNKKLFCSIFKAKIRIARLFPMPIRPIFILINISKLIMSIVLNSLRNIFSQKNLIDSHK